MALILGALGIGGTFAIALKPKSAPKRKMQQPTEQSTPENQTLSIDQVEVGQVFQLIQHTCFDR
jgi:hypothetical protein